MKGLRNFAALAAFGIALALPGAVKAVPCTIQIGGDGETDTLTYDLTNYSTGTYVTWTNLTARSFIRNTSGPCHFYIYNGSNLDGSLTVIGTDLTERIRAGSDGIENKDNGGGDTWKVRSVKIVKVNTGCALNIGGNGIRMNYHISSDLRYIPKSNRFSTMGSAPGYGCQATLYNATELGVNDYYNRMKIIKNTNGVVHSEYDIGFFVRSVYIQRLTDSGCVERDRERCVPQTNLAANLYTSTASADRDSDGLSDYYEDVLAIAFRPVYYNHSTEDASQAALYTDYYGTVQPEPATIYQVRPNGTNQVSIQYNALWYYDSGCSVPGSGHNGDFGKMIINLRTTDGGRHWYAYSTSMHEDGSNWTQDSGQVRSTSFEYWGSAIANHPMAMFMKGKHHNYSDGGWSGVGDVKSGSASPCTCYNNGRGYQINLPARLAGVYLPSGKTTLGPYMMNNVGRAADSYLDNLNIYSSLYNGQFIWNDPAFFESDAAGRGFN